MPILFVYLLLFDIQLFMLLLLTMGKKEVCQNEKNDFILEKKT